LENVEIMMKKLKATYPTKESVMSKVWITTFGLIINDLFENYELPLSTPKDYASLCDWLEMDLIRCLSDTSIKELRLLEDSRVGETFSVRVGFKWDPDKYSLDFGDTYWWEVLEIDTVNRIYSNQDWREIFGGNENE